MSGLPSIPYPTKNKHSYQIDFKGLNHVVGAQDGDLYDMTNLTSDTYPVLSPRQKRRHLWDVKDGKGMFFYGGKLYWIDGSTIYVDGEAIGDVDSGGGKRKFVALNKRVLIFPDGVYIDPDNTVGRLAATTTTAVTFIAKGTYKGSVAENNTIYAEGADWGKLFKVGDAVTISGCKKYEENNKTPIIREIEGDVLRFYENTFKLNSYLLYTAQGEVKAGKYCFQDEGDEWRSFELTSPLGQGDTITWDGNELQVTIGGAPIGLPVTIEKVGTVLSFGVVSTDTSEADVTIAREIPAFEVVCTINNRLWGCIGNVIYGSKLGDPFNFNVFDGLSTDSYQLETETDGAFTAAIGYNGYPMFFKENSISRLYGNYPTNFQLSRQMQQGVKKGCGDTLAIAGEILYYVSKSGVMAYSGGIPAKISDPLGKRIESGIGVSDGEKYYLSASCSDGTTSLYVFDAYKTMWHREDDTELVAASYGDYVTWMTSDSITALPPCGEGTEEGDVKWMVEFADMVFGSPYKKGVAKINLRMRLDHNARAAVDIMYDSNNRWDHVKTIDKSRKHSDILPIIPRRCDHFRLRIRGTGHVEVYSLAVQYYHGSENLGGGVYVNGN